MFVAACFAGIGGGGREGGLGANWSREGSGKSDTLGLLRWAVRDEGRTGDSLIGSSDEDTVGVYNHKHVYRQIHHCFFCTLLN